MGQRAPKVPSFVSHSSQDKIRRSIKYAQNAPDAVGGKALMKSEQDGDSSGDRGFKPHMAARFSGRGEDFVPVMGEEPLIGGDNVLARSQCAQDELAGVGQASERFDDDINVGIFDEV